LDDFLIWLKRKGPKWNESRGVVLVEAVERILGDGDIFSKLGRSQEQGSQEKGAEKRWEPPTSSLVCWDGKESKDKPLTKFTEKVGMTTETK
jgi:hypothetical protein